MSTQHPDNVAQPFFAEGPQLGGDAEIEEAYYAFSHLGCDEQMWDCEGKEVDAFVVKKLLSRYEAFFRDRPLGEDVFLTLRVPNPLVERGEAKILLETLESIPRSYDAAQLFYRHDISPIFEVILPMTTSSQELERVASYYRDFVAGKQHRRIASGDITVAEWVGHFAPSEITVIPLYEDAESMVHCDRITATYLARRDVSHQRVFLARSDPAMNYGVVAAVLLNKVALFKLDALARSTGVAIHPIVGVGSAPFRGNLTPATVGRVLDEYPSGQTFTVQSAFKYDHPPAATQQAIATLRAATPRRAPDVDEERVAEFVARYSERYAEQVGRLSRVVYETNPFVPARRRRKLHVGLFGYARTMRGVALPRAIGFTASLYSVGLPPEVLGLDALTEQDLEFVRSAYVHFDADLRDAVRYLNPDTGLVPAPLLRRLDELGLKPGEDDEHRWMTGRVAELVRGHDVHEIRHHVVRAASLRGFLG